MKKLNRREKTFVRLMALAIAVAVLIQGSDAYFLAKEELTLENESLTERIDRLQKELEGETLDKYTAQSEALAEQVTEAQGRVLELPTENEANLFLSKLISEKAELAGLNINSISNRKAKVIDEHQELSELRTYFGYDSDLRSLLTFFSLMAEQEFYVTVENLNISARRQPRRNLKNRRRNNRIERKPLNGNAILTTVFHTNPEFTMERYDTSGGSELLADPVDGGAGLDGVAVAADEPKTAAADKGAADKGKPLPKTETKDPAPGKGFAPKPTTRAPEPEAEDEDPPEDTLEEVFYDDEAEEDVPAPRPTPTKQPPRSGGLKPAADNPPPVTETKPAGNGPRGAWPNKPKPTQPKLDKGTRPLSGPNKLKSAGGS